MAARMRLPSDLCAGRTTAQRHCRMMRLRQASRATSPVVVAAAAVVGAGMDVPVEAPAKQGWWQKDCPSNMLDVSSAQELVNLLAANRDRLVVVDFYASWCHSCRSLFPKLKKIVADNPDIVVLKINFDDNKQLCKGLNIKVLPYFHMYKGAEGRVDAFTCSIAKIQRMKDALDTHAAPFCSLEEEVPPVPELPELHPQPWVLPPARLSHCRLPDSFQELAKDGQQVALDFAAGLQQQQQLPPAFA